MTDDLTDDPEFNPIEPVEKESGHRGSLMREPESWERLIDGLKMAADGARHMARHASPDSWNNLARYLDAVRKAVIQDGGIDRPSDATESTQQFGGEGQSFSQAQSRIGQGLRMAAAGAEQIGQCQRMDLRWLRYAGQLRKLRDDAHKLAMQGSVLSTDHGWRNKYSGLIIPTRLH